MQIFSFLSLSLCLFSLSIGNVWASSKPGDIAGNLNNLRFIKNALPATAVNADNNSIKIDSLKDKVVLIELWATWCGPCIKRIPEFIKLQKKYADQLHVIVVSNESNELIEKFYKTKTIGMVNSDFSKEANAKALLSNEINFTSVTVDIEEASFKAYFGKPKVWPTFILVNREGIIENISSNDDSITRDIESLIAKNPSSVNIEAKRKIVEINEQLDGDLWNTYDKLTDLVEINPDPAIKKRIFENRKFAIDLIKKIIQLDPSQESDVIFSLRRNIRRAWKYAASNFEKNSLAEDLRQLYLRCKKENFFKQGESYNSMAWEILIEENYSLANPALAKIIATIGLKKITAEKKDIAPVLDTVARAEHLTLNLSAAIRYQELSVAEIRKNSDPDANNKNGLEQTLIYYQTLQKLQNKTTKNVLMSEISQRISLNELPSYFLIDGASDPALAKDFLDAISVLNKKRSIGIPTTSTKEEKLAFNTTIREEKAKTLEGLFSVDPSQKNLENLASTISSSYDFSRLQRFYLSVFKSAVHHNRIDILKNLYRLVVRSEQYPDRMPELASFMMDYPAFNEAINKDPSLLLLQSEYYLQLGNKKSSMDSLVAADKILKKMIGSSSDKKLNDQNEALRNTILEAYRFQRALK